MQLTDNPRLAQSFAEIEKRRSKRAAKPRQFVYVLGCGDFVKIGIAANVPGRLSSLQTGNPHPVEFLGMFPTVTPDQDEDALHREYSEFRQRGEWFKLPAWKLDKLLRKACYHHRDF